MENRNHKTSGRWGTAREKPWNMPPTRACCCLAQASGDRPAQTRCRAAPGQFTNRHPIDHDGQLSKSDRHAQGSREPIGDGSSPEKLELFPAFCPSRLRWKESQGRSWRKSRKIS